MAMAAGKRVEDVDGSKVRKAREAKFG